MKSLQNNDAFGNDYNAIDVPIGRSNIIPKELKFTLNAFRNLHTLKCFALSTENIIDISLLRSTLLKICVHNTTITHLNQVLLCDNVHKTEAHKIVKPNSHSTTNLAIRNENNGDKDIDLIIPATRTTTTSWSNISELNLSGNLLIQIDESICTVPQLKILILEQNRLRNITNLVDLPHLHMLSLSANLISDCNDWHLKLGNLVTLNLSQNKLKSIKGLNRLLSLINLDLSSNLIDDLNEVDYVACLPLLETLSFTGNPLATTVGKRNTATLLHLIPIYYQLIISN